MRQLVLTPKFKHAYRKFSRRNKKMCQYIDLALRQMEQELFASSLATHKLGGTLAGLWACSCGYDCRIVFSFRNRSSIEQRGNRFARCWYAHSSLLNFYSSIKVIIPSPFETRQSPIRRGSNGRFLPKFIR